MEGLKKFIKREVISKPKEEFPEGTLVSKEGVPLLLYRGSSLSSSLSKEQRYNPEHLGHSTEAPSAGEAFFFTSRKRTADYYSRGKHPNKEYAVKQGGDPHIDTVHLVMKNPLIHDFKGKLNRAEEETYYNLLRKAKEQGYDGVIFKNTFDGGEYTHLDRIMDGKFLPETIYGVFSPDQILIQETKSLIPEKRRIRMLEAERKRREARIEKRRLKRQKS